MKKRPVQFGLLGLLVIVTCAAIIFALVRPTRFPSDMSIRMDMGIPESIDIVVYDRQIVSGDKKTQYWATVHVAEKPHRLVRVWCQTKSTFAQREKWEPYVIHESYDTGMTLWRVCEKLYGHEPTEKDREEFREFALNFR